MDHSSTSDVKECGPVLRNAEDLAHWTKALCEARGISASDAVPKIKKWASGEATLSDFPTTDTLKAMAEEAGLLAPTVDLWDVLPATPFDEEQTLSGEVRAWAHRLSTAHQLIIGPRFGRPMSAERTAEMAELIAAKFIYEGERPLTHAANAENQAKHSAYPVTQIEGILSRRGIIQPRTTQWQRVREALVAACPKTADEIAANVGEMLGAGMSTHAALDWASAYLGEEVDFRWEDIPGTGPVLLHEKSGGWFRVAHTMIRNAIRFRGAAWMPVIYADALRETGEAISWTRFVAAVERIRGYRPVGQRGWFTIAAADQNKCFDLIDNILANAGRACSIETVHEGVFRAQASHGSRDIRDGLPNSHSCVMPLAEFSELIEESSRYRVIQGGGIDIANLEDRYAALRRLEPMRTFIDFTKSMSGIVTTTEATLASGAGKYMTLHTSPIFRLIEGGIYAIRGMKIDPARLAEAQAEKERNARASNVEVLADGTVTFLASFALADKAKTGRKGLRGKVPAKALGILHAGTFQGPGDSAQMVISGEDMYINRESAQSFGIHGAQRLRVFINPKRDEVDLVPMEDSDDGE